MCGKKHRQNCVFNVPWCSILYSYMCTLSCNMPGSKWMWWFFSILFLSWITTMLLKCPIMRIVERERDIKTWYLIYDCNFVLDCRKGFSLKRCVPTTPVHKRRTLFRRSRGTFQVVWPQQTWRELLKFDNFWKLYYHIPSKSFEFQQGSQWHLTTLVVLFLKRVSELYLFEFLTSIFVLVL